MPFSRIQPDANNQFMPSEAKLILDSYRHFLGKSCVDDTDLDRTAQLLYEAPFALVAHEAGHDPIFVYANRTAQTLFEMDWPEITSTPSRLSAEPILQQERQTLLDRVNRDGFITDYSGIRISKSGKRFWIRNAIVWNLINADRQKIGQAACFDSWEPIET